MLFSLFERFNLRSYEQWPLFFFLQFILIYMSFSLQYSLASPLCRSARQSSLLRTSRYNFLQFSSSSYKMTSFCEPLVQLLTVPFHFLQNDKLLRTSWYNSKQFPSISYKMPRSCAPPGTTPSSTPPPSKKWHAPASGTTLSSSPPFHTCQSPAHLPVQL